MTTITCNLNCVCVDSDCTYKHYITYKERKIVKQFYDEISLSIRRRESISNDLYLERKVQKYFNELDLKTKAYLNKGYTLTSNNPKVAAKIYLDLFNANYDSDYDDDYNSYGGNVGNKYYEKYIKYKGKYFALKKQSI